MRPYLIEYANPQHPGEYWPTESWSTKCWVDLDHVQGIQVEALQPWYSDPNPRPRVELRITLMMRNEPMIVPLWAYIYESGVSDVKALMLAETQPVVDAFIAAWKGDR